jgi:hypothetical protein
MDLIRLEFLKPQTANYLRREGGLYGADADYSRELENA